MKSLPDETRQNLASRKGTHMGITTAQFNGIQKGDRFTFCADGTFTATAVHKNRVGDTLKIAAKNDDGETITFGPDDAVEIVLL